MKRFWSEGGDASSEVASERSHVLAKACQELAGNPTDAGASYMQVGAGGRLGRGATLRSGHTHKSRAAVRAGRETTTGPCKQLQLLLW